MFAQRHYEAVAAAIRDAITPGEAHLEGELWRARWRLVYHLSVMFMADNPRFKARRFALACGIEGFYL